MNPDYEVLAPLAEGPRFELLSARRVRTGARVLLRRARLAAATPADLAAMQRECAIAAAVPGAASLLPRLVETPPPALLVMEDPGGELLAQRLARGPLPVGTVLALARPLAAALAELHRRGLRHNGVRPEAVWVRSDGGMAWFVDFADAGAADAPAAPLPALPRLPYLSPEQTGRVERAVDPRSDLYAFGIVLHEMLTGAPPFRSADPLEIIHWHLAGRAAEPAAGDPAIPAPLSALVARLLERSPDDRYQSADGVLHDLEHCAREWAAGGRIAPFVLGRGDRRGQLVLPARLYGREAELRQLQEAFEQARDGRAGGMLLLVAGDPGVGKTALIEQRVRPLVQAGGRFVSGKFDQVVRGVPFGALVEALRALVRQLLGESEAQLAQWRAALARALGANGGVLAEVMPEIEFIVGPQLPPVPLAAPQALNRFQHVLQKFVAAVARPGQPLVLFLDDLQWADAATLALLEPLLTAEPAGGLLLIGACRDGELAAAPRLQHTLAALEQAGVALRRLTLRPLAEAELTMLVADALHLPAAACAPLARLVHRKTGGNPFFVRQFLALLAREGHLRFDAECGGWCFSLEQIAAAPLADDVIDLTTRRIARLDARTQYALTLAACIGNRFELSTLAVVSEQPEEAAAAALQPAADEGLIVADAAAPGVPPAYAFLHDRVQQAAYALIPAGRRERLHLRIGRLLRARAGAVPADAALFDIVNQLNLGRRLIDSAAERREVAALNLAAGRRAKSSTAHDSALELFEAGVGLLDAAAWDEAPELAFALHLEAAEALALCGRHDAAQAALAALDRRARSPLEHAQIERLRSVGYEYMGRYADALASAHRALAQFGVVLPQAPAAKAAALEHEIAAIETLRAGREIAALAALPPMTDGALRLVMATLTDMWSAAYLVGDPDLARLVSATMVRLSLEHGNAEESAYGYVTHAITVGPVRGDYAAAYAYGRLALAVNERFGDTRRRAKICQQFQAHVNLWCQPFETGIPYAREACRAGLDSGDFLYAAYGAGTEPWAALACTQDLEAFVREHEGGVALLERLKNPDFADSLRVILNFARALQGRGAGPLALGGGGLDEPQYLERVRDHPFFTALHAVLRLHLCALLGSPAQALEAARHSATLVHHLTGTLWPVVHDLWWGLAIAANAGALPAAERAAALDGLRRAQAGFAARARHCAQNFGAQALLLAAAIAQCEGRSADALALAEQAVEFCAARPLRPLQALAHETCARLRRHLGQPALAALHAAQACEHYARWRAAAKVHALQREFALAADGDAPAAPAIPLPAADAAGAAETDGGHDLASVLKSTQAIAAEVDFDALVARLLRIAVENAGAERGALVLAGDDGALVVHASDARDGVALDADAPVPAAIVRYVHRTGEAQRLSSAEAERAHGADPYLARHRPHSLLCLTVRRPERGVGVLYLEHRRIDGVFTPPRLRTLQALAAQAAVSIENARLVGGLRREVQQRQQAQERLAAALAEVRRLKDDLETENSLLRRDLIANVSHDLRTPLMAMRGHLELLATRGDTLSAAQRAEYLGVALRQSTQLARLIDELFELAKLDFEGIALARESFSFGELAADVLQKFRLEAASRDVELALEGAPRGPLVDADLGLMERLLENLVHNALQHTPAGGRVTVTLASEPGRLVACVSDTGCGIAPADLPFVFDRFYRGATKRRAGRDRGAGLGLAIARRIVELHGGEIGVASDGRNGSCFRFSVPLAAG